MTQVAQASFHSSLQFSWHNCHNSQELFQSSHEFMWHKCHKTFFHHLSNSRGTSVTRIISISSRIHVATVSQDFSNLLSNSDGTSVTRIFSIITQIRVAQVSQELFHLLMNSSGTIVTRFFPSSLKFPWHKCHKDSFSKNCT